MTLHFLVASNRISSHSWDHVAFNLLQQLNRMGVEYVVHEFAGPNVPDVNNPQLPTGLGSDDILVAMFRPVVAQRKKSRELAQTCPQALRICYSMAPEATRVCEGEVKCYNDCFHGVMVPTQFGMDSLRASGVIPPIHVVRHGFDPEFFYEEKRDFRSETFRLLYVGKGKAHKDSQVLYDTMTLLEDGEYRNDKIELIIKASTKGGGCPDKVNRGHRNIRYICDTLTREDLSALFRESHVGIFCSHGEGFGMPALESLATGAPVIIPEFGGFLEYCSADNAFFAPSYSIPAAANGNSGEWRQVIAGQLALLIGSLSRNRGLVEAKAAVARNSVKHLTWENAAKEMLDAIANIKRRWIADASKLQA